MKPSVVVVVVEDCFIKVVVVVVVVVVWKGGKHSVDEFPGCFSRFVFNLVTN